MYSKNYLALRASIDVPESLLEEVEFHQQSDVGETLVIFTTKAQPNWAIEHGIEIVDLRKQAEIEQWIDSLHPQDYRLIRIPQAGGELLGRGQWLRHSFSDVPEMVNAEVELAASQLRNNEQCAQEAVKMLRQLHGWMARARFENTQDELQAMRFAERILKVVQPSNVARHSVEVSEEPSV